MERDVICGMQVDPATAAGQSRVQGEDLLLLLDRLQDEVRLGPGAVRQVNG